MPNKLNHCFTQQASNTTVFEINFVWIALKSVFTSTVISVCNF